MEKKILLNNGKKKFFVFFVCSAMEKKWDSDDVARLKMAQRAQMGGAGMSKITDGMVLSAIGRRELARHCRRRTQGVERTTKLVENLLTFYCGASGREMAGMPLLDKERIHDVRESQKKHVSCI